MVKIYTLADPISGEIRYVGKTKFSLHDRLCKHLITYERNHRANWIRSLQRNGLKPTIELLEEVEDENWIIREIYWIANFKQRGFRLLNATIGGETGIISSQCREACIRANRGRKASEEEIIKRRQSSYNKPVVKKDKKGNILSVYISGSEAARQTGCQLSHIIECCNKKPKRKTHKGFIWEYQKH